MYDKDAEFDLLFAPKQYPTYEDDDDGVWRVVNDEDGQAIGVVWTNGTDAAGMNWLRQTEQAVKIRQSLYASCSAGIRAADGYALVESEFERFLEEPVFGKMLGITAEMEEIMEDLDN